MGLQPFERRYSGIQERPREGLNLIDASELHHLQPPKSHPLQSSYPRLRKITPIQVRTVSSTASI